ncbi:MAG: hypothetical protein WBV74_18460 [Pseudonocardiaceae bacterium]
MRSTPQGWLLGQAAALGAAPGGSGLRAPNVPGRARGQRHLDAPERRALGQQVLGRLVQRALGQRYPEAPGRSGPVRRHPVALKQTDQRATVRAG